MIRKPRARAGRERTSPAGNVSPAGDGATLTAREFALFQQLVYESAGIQLGENKSALLVGRLGSRVRQLGLRSFGEYHELASRNYDELVQLLDRIVTNETQFFREPMHFEFLASSVFPAWERDAQRGRRSRTIRVWSAACSTGEEPYSLAMALLDRFGPDSGWSVEILATDISTRALEHARRAIWPAEKASRIPFSYRQRWMLRGRRTQEGRLKAGPGLRSAVRFARLNLSDESYPALGTFDLIFCRNALIYFSAESRRRVIDRLLRHLTADGYFFLGHAETLNGVTDVVRCVVPTVYARPENAAAGTVRRAAPLAGRSTAVSP